MSDPNTDALEERVAELEHQSTVYSKETDELRSKVKLLGEYINQLETAGFMSTNHAVADNARNRMRVIAKGFKDGT